MHCFSSETVRARVKKLPKRLFSYETAVKTSETAHTLAFLSCISFYFHSLTLSPPSGRVISQLLVASDLSHITQFWLRFKIWMMMNSIHFLSNPQSLQNQERELQNLLKLHLLACHLLAPPPPNPQQKTHWSLQISTVICSSWRGGCPTISKLRVLTVG